jgi:hypothetical protein
VGADGVCNDCSSITVKNLQGTQYQITVQRFQGVTSKGRIISLFDAQQFDLNLRTTDRDSEGFFVLFLIPVDGEAGSSKGTDVTSGEPVHYEPVCKAQVADEGHDGLVIARFKADGAIVTHDPNFLPLCFTINASPQSLRRFEAIGKTYQRLMESVELYVKALVNRKGLEPIWVFSVELFRLMCRHKSVFFNTNQQSQTYFVSVQVLIDAIIGELKVLASEYKEAKLLGEIHSSIDHLSHPLLTVSLDMNMARPYEVVQEAVEEVAHLLSRFPEGPAVEASLAVKEMTFSKGTAYNKLVIQFVEEISYSKDQSNLVFKLRDFSTREPSTWDIRLALGGDMPYGSLPQLNNLLKKVGTDEFDFRIECPGEVIGTGKMRQLTLYLPPPLGESVDTPRARVTVSMVS